MGQILSSSASLPLVIDTEYGALSTRFFIESLEDQHLDQLYDNALNQYSPDRVQTALVLKPRLSISDPDGILPSEATAFTRVLWEEIQEYSDNQGDPVVTTPKDVTAITETVIISGVPVRVYTVQSNGNLVVRRNVPYTKSFRLKCTVTYTDTRNGETLEFSDNVLLQTTKTAELNYIFKVDTPKERTFRPLLGNGTVSNVTFGVTLMLGADEVSTAKYFWYWSDASHTNGVLFGDTSTPCAAYVSGQGTKVLTVNPDRTAGLTIFVRAATATSAASPTLDLREHFSLVVLYDTIEGVTTSKNGSRLLASQREMAFEEVLHVKGRDINLSVRADYIRLHWTYKTDNASAVTNAGTGDEIVISRANLATTSGRSKIVAPKIEILGPLDYLTDDSPGGSGYVIDDSSGTSPNYNGYCLGRT